MKLAVITLGCSKNLVDTEHYLGILVNKKGFEITTEVESLQR